MSQYKCDIILPVCDQLDYAKNCVESIVKHTKISYRIIVIDNGKSQEVKDYLLEAKAKAGDKIHIIDAGDNIGWVRSINIGVELSKAPYICFQNDDTIVTEGWLSIMIRIMEENKNVGVVNPSWEKSEDISPDDYAKTIKRYETDFIEMDWCRGFCMLVRREVVDKVGGLDKIYIPFYYDDWDYSLKAINEGFICVLAKGVFVLHYRNVTAENVLRKEQMKKIMDKNGKIFYRKWGKPYKFIFVLNGNMDLLGEGIKELCRLQNKLKCFVTESSRYINTTLTEKKIPVFLSAWIALCSFVFMKREKVAGSYGGVFTNSKFAYIVMNMFNFKNKMKVIFERNPSRLAKLALEAAKINKAESMENVKD